MDQNGSIIEVRGNNLLVNQIINNENDKNYKIQFFKLKSKSDKLRQYELRSALTLESFSKGYLESESNLLLLSDNSFYTYNTENKEKTPLVYLNDCDPIDFVYLKKDIIFIKKDNNSLYYTNMNGDCSVLLKLIEPPLKLNFCYNNKNVIYLKTNSRLYFLKCAYLKDKSLKLKNTNMSLPSRNKMDTEEYAFHSYKNHLYKIKNEYKQVIHVCSYTNKEVIIYKFVKGVFKNKKKCLAKLYIDKLNGENIKGAFFFKVNTGMATNTDVLKSFNDTNTNIIEENNEINETKNNVIGKMKEGEVDVPNNSDNEKKKENSIKLYLLVFSENGKVLIYFIDYLNQEKFKFGLVHINNANPIIYIALPFKTVSINNVTDMFYNRVIKQKNIIQKKKKLSNNFNKYMEHISNKEKYINSNFFMDTLLMNDNMATIYTIQIHHDFLYDLETNYETNSLSIVDSNNKIIGIKSSMDISDKKNVLNKIINQSKFSCYSDSDSYIDSDITWNNSDKNIDDAYFCSDYSSEDEQIKKGMTDLEKTQENKESKTEENKINTINHEETTNPTNQCEDTKLMEIQKFESIKNEQDGFINNINSEKNDNNNVKQTEDIEYNKDNERECAEIKNDNHIENNQNDISENGINYYVKKTETLSDSTEYNNSREISNLSAQSIESANTFSPLSFLVNENETDEHETNQEVTQIEEENVASYRKGKERNNKNGEDNDEGGEEDEKREERENERKEEKRETGKKENDGKEREREKEESDENESNHSENDDEEENEDDQNEEKKKKKKKGNDEQVNGGIVHSEECTKLKKRKKESDEENETLEKIKKSKKIRNNKAEKDEVDNILPNDKINQNNNIETVNNEYNLLHQSNQIDNYINPGDNNLNNNFIVVSSIIKMNLSLKRYKSLKAIINKNYCNTIYDTIKNLGKKYSIKLLEHILNMLTAECFLIINALPWIKAIYEIYGDTLRRKKHRILVTKLSELTDLNIKCKYMVELVTNKINYIINNLMKNNTDNPDILTYKNGTIMK
ncbi:conserved Plasmodium protein, unknown function [Plasmodium berghei]|uniref:Uncharacterized protein n=2 Tax=Plasmodium berghei TaxID=5821 RepID=A0A509ALF6_PLABA|nr:conserved Plasmodium protein, unknown function [Plasmodium berghei ANKA]CXI41369.1 conserved Plasmodium protein, unknown function [Plasmodium berghei]SCM21912.1 conserved Plasmodium protein, unknown function [Plasmodium berghei]SCO61742.1 conserved Plasmodium protein, unknown function [Plasmodium berghei]VUC55661.1 conserved Plasmodium protein, unknown function [Plasmodium berghei ANKA]|eukprot:XP_034421471.1 conserved Plasmodium protein, unknown function [Plasmodium berghei ANKA]